MAHFVERCKAAIGSRSARCTSRILQEVDKRSAPQREPRPTSVHSVLGAGETESEVGGRARSTPRQACPNDLRYQETAWNGGGATLPSARRVRSYAIGDWSPHAPRLV